MPGTVAYSAFSRIGQLASLPRVHAAFQWFHLHERKIMQWQQELVSIAAPPFGEGRRAEWLAERFKELKLEQVEIDAEGNVLGCHRGKGSQSGRPCVMLSAHIDTVFPIETPIAPLVEHNRLEAPGACDNGAGVAGILGVAAALESCGIVLPCDLLFAGNVGEEGEGDLRGMRYLYGASPWRERIGANVVLDGAGCEVVVTQALGSRRYLVTMQGPGGHSWTDAGTPNPIVVLSRAIAAMSEVALPASPRTTLNIGTIEGGSSVNSIPEFATARFDLRSLDAEQLVRLELSLRRAVEEAVLAANTSDRSKSPVQFLIERIGDRPAGRLQADSRLLEALHAVDRHLGIRTEQRVASTDANIPLSLGIQALSIGAGGDGGGIHTRGEWYDASGRELALKRILLLLLLALDHVSLEVGDRQGMNAHGFSGRHALYLSLGAMLLCCAPLSTQTVPPVEAIYYHGNILTGVGLGGSRPERVTAIAVGEHQIAAAGDDATVLRRKQAGTKLIDLHGAFVMPGINDAHVHLADAGQTKLAVDLTGSASLAEMLRRINAAAAAAPVGQWLLGGGWDHTLWAGKTLPTRQDLDPVTRGHPAIFSRIDGHIAVVNSAALALSGVTSQTPNPQGGQLDHDTEGHLTGIVREDSAQDLIRQHIPPPSHDLRRRAILLALDDAATHGVTSVQDNSDWEDFLVYEELEREGRLRVRISEWLRFNDPVELLLAHRAVHPAADRMLRTGMLKGFMDGSLGSRTAALLSPYADDPGNSGLPRYDQARLDAMTKERAAAGFQIGFHAIGDRAVEMALERLYRGPSQGDARPYRTLASGGTAGHSAV